MGRSTDMRSVALVVDDDADERSLAAAILEETDLRVVEASSGEQALDYLRTRAGEVVFLFTGTRLPCLMSGLDLARNVQSNWPWIRVMVTSDTSLGQDELIELPREVRVMSKPWNALDVLIEAERANAGQPAFGFS
jgi:CheY-like chemotaxis protein